MIDRLEDKKGPGLAQVVALSWPASLTMLNVTVMKFVDGLMVSRVGADPFSAQFVGGMFSFVPQSFVVGMLTVVNTYVSQNFGQGNFRQAARYAWAGIILALAAGGLMAPLALVAPQLFALLDHTPHIFALEVMYFRYLILAVGFSLSARALEQFLFGIHRPRTVLVISLGSNGANLLINYVLIFGKLGFPAMGLQGAAIGTVTAWGLNFVSLLVVFCSGSIHRRFASRFAFTVRWRHCRDVLRLGWPAGTQVSNDVLCWSLFIGALVGRFFGPAHLTASVAAMRYLGLSFMPAVGIGVATTALVGRFIGAGRKDLARKRARTGLLVAMTYMGACGLAFYIFRRPMVEFFVKVSPSARMTSVEAAALADQIVRIGARVMICAAVFQLFDAVGIIYIGALRGAGDTFWPMVVTMVLSWTVILGGGLAMVGFLPELRSIGPWLAGSAYVVLLGVCMAWRFESGAWERIDLLHRRPGLELSPAEPGADATGIIPASSVPVRPDDSD